MRALTVLMACTAVMGASVSAAPAATVKAGIDAWQRGEYADAVGIWRPLAEAGNADAAFNLGQAYRLGRGVPTNLAAAQTWLSRAANKNHLDAQTTLGLLLFDSGDTKGAMRWLKAAAERGEPRAQLVYGTALFNGDGVPKDPVLAYAFISRSAAQGLSAAKGTLQDLNAILPPAQRKKGAAMANEVIKSKLTASPPKAVAEQAPAPKAKPPTPAPKVAAASAPLTQGGWRIQLGAFSKRASAQQLYARLAGADPVRGKSAAYVAAGAVTRLQVGPFPSRAAATAACATLSRKGQACFPVKGD